MKLTAKQSRDIMKGNYRYVKRGNKLYRVEFINEKFIGTEIMSKVIKEFKSQYYDLRKKCGLL